MPVGDRESRQAPASADAPDRQIQAPAPTAQLASQIGNRAFAALVARFPGDDFGDGISIGSHRLRGGMGGAGSTERMHADIYGDSSLAHAPGPNVDVTFEREAERLNALSDAELATELGTRAEDSLRRLDDGAQRALGGGRHAAARRDPHPPPRARRVGRASGDGDALRPRLPSRRHDRAR
jgi:hypothetical protein